VLALVIAAGPGAIGHFVSTWPLRWVPANVPPLLQLAIPFLATGLAWLVLHQSIRPGHVIGGSITMVGVAGALRSPAGRRLVAREEVILATQSAE
jgi:drug/metabolite transporter (DMT)-like permease